VNNWETTVKRFNALGGVTDNVVLGEGAFGRGLFPKNFNQPIRMSIPNHLLCPTEWLVINAEGNLVLTDDCNWDAETKAFYLDYQHDYGIGGSLMHEMLQKQTELYNLADPLKSMLIGYGMSESLFQKPSIQAGMELYKSSRRIIYQDKLVLMPLVELVNHNEHTSKSFDKVPQLGISGKFKNEILVHYGMAGDAALMFEGYGFSSPKPYSFSGSLAINLGAKSIKISRFVTLYKTIVNTNVPRLKVEGDTIHLSCLVLGSVNDRSSPKIVFTKLMHTVGMPANIASNVFDGIVEQNKSFFLHLLEELKPLEGSVVEGLRTMAKYQLVPLGVRV